MNRKQLAIPSAIGAALATNVHSATIMVDSNDGGTGGTGDCTLSEAIEASNTNSSQDACDAGSSATTDTIDLSGIAGQTISLSTSLPRLSYDVVIEGANVTIDGNHSVRHFSVGGAGVVTINSVTLQNGSTADVGGSIMLYSRAELSLNHSTVSGNTSDASGGGVHAAPLSNFRANYCTFQHNSASGDGGAIALAVYADHTSRANTFYANSSGARGGAIFANRDASAIILRSTIAGNSALQTGGAIYSRGDRLRIINSTIHGNASDSGDGGIEFDSAASGSGIALDLRNSIISGSTGGSDCSATYTAIQYSIIGDASCGIVDGVDGNLSGDPRLAELSANGGPTETMRPLATSPAIDFLDSSGASCQSDMTDQRGQPRPVDFDGVVNNDCDIGSVEVDPSVDLQQNEEQILVNTLGADNDGLCGSLADGLDCTIREAIDLANTNTLTTSVITFADAATLGISDGSTASVTFFEDGSAYDGINALPLIASNIDIQGPTDFDLVLDATDVTCSIDGIADTGERRIAHVTSGNYLTLSNMELTGGCADGSFTATYGGGLLVSPSATLTTTDVTLSNHQATRGGGVHIYGGKAYFNKSTINDNSALTGAGVYATYAPYVAITNTTVSGNSANYAGGVFAFGAGTAIFVSNSTLASNTATGSGGAALYAADSANVTVNNSILADSNTSDCFRVDANAPSIANSLVETPGNCGVTDGAGGNIVADPMLNALADNGGATLTHLPQLGSPVLDAVAANPVSCDAQTEDQRGFTRPMDFDSVPGSDCDMGAVEYSGAQSNASIIVNTLATDDDGFCGDLADGFDCSIREAINLANADDSTSSTITFADAATLGVTAGDTAIIQFIEDASTQTGDNAWPLIDSDITIDGRTDFTVQFAASDFCNPNGISEAGERRLAQVLSGHLLAMNDLAISDGCADGSIAPSRGGAILVDSSASVNLSRVSISNSFAVRGGGIFANDGGVLVNQSTLSENSAFYGGAVMGDQSASVTFDRSTISNNSAAYGGGLNLYNSSTANITNTTFSDQLDGGAIYAGISSSFMANYSILANSMNGQDCTLGFGSSATITNSLIETDFLCGTTDGVDGNIKTDPTLGALADNGGTTLTHLPLAGSPVIDAYPTMGGLCNGLPEDQRGEARPAEGDAIGDIGCDFGSVEVAAEEQPDTAIVVNATDDVDNGICGVPVGSCNLREAVALANSDINASTITFDPTVFGTAQTITLNAGQLEIMTPTTVTGPGSNLLQIDANAASRHFDIDDVVASTNIDVELTGMTLSNGSASRGGAVFAIENLVLEDMALTSNYASVTGGGLYSRPIAEPGSVAITTSVFNGNLSDQSGGTGAHLVGRPGGSISIVSSTANGNINSATGLAIASGGGLRIEADDTDVFIGNTEISDNTLDGDGRASGGGLFIDAESSSVVTLDGVTVSNNTAGSNAATTGIGGGILFFSDTTAQLVISNATITGNTTLGSSSAGGGIYAGGYNFEIRDSLVANNVASGNAGGIFAKAYAATSVIIDRVTISNNSAAQQGGGLWGYVYENASLSVTNSTFVGNTGVGLGGGVRLGFYNNDGYARIADSTIAGNTVSNEAAGIGGGGGLALESSYASNAVVIERSIVAANADNSSSATPDFSLSGITAGDVTVRDTLIGDNTGSGLAEAQSPDADGNLIGSAMGAGIIDPLLGALADNGGFTATRLPLGGSPAVDFTSGCAATDQRGEARATDADGVLDGNECDIGAVEVQNAIPMAVDDLATTDQNTPISGNIIDDVPGTDSDADDEDSGTLTISAASADASGVGVDILAGSAALAISADGSYTFQPDSAYAHLDDGESELIVVDYTLSDGFATDTAQLDITVNGLNDAPTAANVSETTTENDSILLVPATADVDDEALGYAVLSQPTSGIATSNGDGSFTFDPNGELESLDTGDTEVFTFGFTVSDGDVTVGAAAFVTVNGVNDAPLATDDVQTVIDGNVLNVDAANGLLANDTDVEGDALTVTTTGTFTPTGGGTLTINADGSFSYDPSGRTADTITFVYTISDGDDEAMATLTIGVTPNDEADLSITKDDGRTSVMAGEFLTYTITVTNHGPIDVTGAQVTDTLPDSLINATWTCSADMGAFCNASGTGDINELVDLDAGTSVTFSLTAQVNPVSPITDVVNTATVAAPMAVTDTNPDNNSATDLTAGNIVFADGFETPVILKAFSAGSAILTKQEILHRIKPTEGETLILHAQDKGADSLKMALVYARIPDGELQIQISRSVSGQLDIGRWEKVETESVEIRWDE